jgi:hypothetical protein
METGTFAISPSVRSASANHGMACISFSYDSIIKQYCPREGPSAKPLVRIWAAATIFAIRCRHYSLTIVSLALNRLWHTTLS